MYLEDGKLKPADHRDDPGTSSRPSTDTCNFGGRNYTESGQIVLQAGCKVPEQFAKLSRPSSVSRTSATASCGRTSATTTRAARRPDARATRGTASRRTLPTVDRASAFRARGASGRRTGRVQDEQDTLVDAGDDDRLRIDEQERDPAMRGVDHGRQAAERTRRALRPPDRRQDRRHRRQCAQSPAKGGHHRTRRGHRRARRDDPSRSTRPPRAPRSSRGTRSRSAVSGTSRRVIDGSRQAERLLALDHR